MDERVPLVAGGVLDTDRRQAEVEAGEAGLEGRGEVVPRELDPAPVELNRLRVGLRMLAPTLVRLRLPLELGLGNARTLRA